MTRFQGMARGVIHWLTALLLWSGLALSCSICIHNGLGQVGDPVGSPTLRAREECSLASAWLCSQNMLHWGSLVFARVSHSPGFGEFKFPTGGVDGGAPDAGAMDEDDLYS